MIYSIKYKEGAPQNLLEVNSNDGGAHVGGQKNITWINQNISTPTLSR